MEASGDQLAEYGGSTAVLTRAGSVPSRGLKASDGDTSLGFARGLRAVPAPVAADAAGPLVAAGHASRLLPSDSPSSPNQPLAAESPPADSPSSPDQPLSLGEISGLLAAAAAAAPRILAAADYVEAAEFAGGVEDLSRSVEYLQVLAAGSVDRTRTQAIAAADAARASRSRTGKGWVTGWDNGVETLNETDTAWPGDAALNSSPASVSAANGSAVRGARTQIELDRPGRVVTSPADDGCANTAEFLRQRLRIGKSEAHRRLALAADILPTTTLTGHTIPATREHLAAALTPTPAPAAAGNVHDTAGTEDTGADTENTAEDTAITSQATTSPAVSSRAGTIIALTLNRLGHLVTPERLALIEQNLTTTAATTDPDFLTRVARRWADTIDADGTEPSEEALRHTQGAFIRKPRHGLHHIEIFATADQYEHLLTVMNTATNPRTQPGNGAEPDTSGTEPHTQPLTGPLTGAGFSPAAETAANDAHLERRTRPQQLLDGLVGACKTALAANTLPATGGLRPQVMVTINYQDLLTHLHTCTGTGTGGWTTAGNGSSAGSRPGTESRPGTGTGPGHGTGSRNGPGSGTFVFSGPVTASTVRKIACDPDIIPVLLGSEGRILDIGRTTRIFPPHIRKALTARDQGCAFPNCTIPAPWCEAHHTTYWSHGGPTNTDNGVLLCTHHHHLIHKEHWQIHIKTGIPWFIPPPHIDPRQKPRRNHHHRT